MKEILIITDSIDINSSSGSKTNLAIIDNLVYCGFNVFVIHNTNNKNIDTKYNNSKIVISKWDPLYLLGGGTRFLFRHTGININKWFESVFGFSAEFFSTAKAYTRAINRNKKQYDLVLTLSIAASFRPHYGALKCYAIHEKWLAYIHDPYPFHFYPRPYNWVQPGYNKKEQFFHKLSQNAKWFGFPSRLLMDWMSSYFPTMEKKSVLIPHQISKVEVPVFNTSSYWNPEAFNLLHAGSLMKQRPADGLILGFQRFLKKNPESAEFARLHLIGPADYHAKKLKEYSDETPQIKLNLKGVSFKEAYWLQKEASVNIILESKSEISPFLPGKFPHCIEANKPVILLSPYYSESRRLLGSDYPFWCENDDIEKISNYIELIYSDWFNKINYEINRPDLLEYMGVGTLQNTINNLLN